MTLVPAGTELVAALGLEGHLVGVSHRCQENGYASLPTVTSTDLRANGAKELDREVRDRSAAGQALYRTDLDTLAGLEPDVVVAQSICDVCAPTGTNVDLPGNADLVELQGSTIEGLYDDLRRLGEATGRAEAAQSVMEHTRERLAEVRSMTGRVDPVPAVTLEWAQPPFAAGHWIPELVALAGGEDVLGQPGEAARPVDWDAVVRSDPETVVYMPCGYNLEQAEREARQLVVDEPVAGLRATREGRFWAVDADRLFSRLTPRAVGRGAEVLAGILHPDQYPPPSAREATPGPGDSGGPGR